MVVLLGANQLFRVKSRERQSVQSETQFRQNPCQHSHTSSQGHIPEFPADAVRALIRAGSITRARAINDFPPFICDSVKDNPQANTVRKERAAQQAQAFVKKSIPTFGAFPPLFAWEDVGIM